MSTSYSHVFINELTSKLDTRIVSFYESNYNKSKFFSRSLDDIVEELVQSEMSDVVGKDALRQLATSKNHARAVKKRRYYKKCSDMVDTNERNNDSDKYFMKNTLIQYNLTAENKRPLLFEGLSFIEIEERKLKDIYDWANDSSSLMIEYPGEEKQTATSISSNFKMDAFINILQIIKIQYNYDLSRATYAVMNDFRNQPIFGAHRNTVLTKDLEDDPKKIVIYKSEDKEQQLVMIIPDEMIDEKTNRIKLFDSKDESILSYLINRWDEKLPSASIHGVPLIDIAAAVNPKGRRSSEEYNDIVNRIFRMYAIRIDGINKNVVGEGMHILSGFKYDSVTKYIYYAFDPFYMDTFKNLRIRKMSSTPLGILTNDAAKILYSRFMEQRRNAYKQAVERDVIPDEYIIPLEYNYLLYWCNFGDQNKRKSYHNDIIDALEDFKQHHILVKDYSYIASKKIYKIIFYPLTEDEIKDFNFYYNIKELPENNDDTLDGEQLNFFLPIIE